MLVRLLSSEVVQGSHVLQGDERRRRIGDQGFIFMSRLQSEHSRFLTEGATNRPFTHSCAARTHRFFDDVKALLVYLEGGHLLDDLLQEDVLLVAVTFD